MEADESQSKPGIRLQKFLRDNGFGSRRKSDLLVVDGAVRVNGRIVTEPTVYLAPGDTVEAAGREVVVPQTAQPHVYLRYHKPPGLVSTHRDEHGRRTIFTQLVEAQLRTGMRPLLFAGRLDTLSRGLMILSTDGDFIQELIHPSHEVEREYEVSLSRPIRDDELAKLSEGTVWNGVRYAPFRFERLTEQTMRLILGEGKKREVRQIFESAGHAVVDLCRVRIGRYTLNQLPEGTWTWLEPDAKPT
ncbi:MAG: rRNA pseudouridine synthase [Spirochaetes bacterium]|nr:rRNA pseudouridine synthase [Spirochaetota bacterium]